jgi:Mn2+/Fe2+ NRAMP family transporter
MIADVDAASILTAAENGAAYGYGMIWILLLLTVPLFIVQETAGRIGAATGKGLGEVIRTSYSRRTALLMTAPMAVTDVFSYVAEYTGIAIGMSLLGVPPLLSVPAAFLAHLVVVYKRKYATVERVLLAISLVFVASYLGSLLLRGVVDGSPLYVSSDPRFLYLAVADIGAVVMPFMLFFQASATAEKRTRSVWASRLETLLGAIASEAIMVVIVMVSAGIPSMGNLTGPGELSLALSSVAGSYAPILFGVGLVCAAFLALVVISLAGAWGVAEALGWGRRRYFWVYLAESIPAALVPLLFPDLISLALGLMVAFVFVLMGPGIIAGVIASRRDVMGEHVSRGAWKAAYWLCLFLILAFGVIGVAAQL